MKKVLSLLLAFAMILGVVIPSSVNASGESESKLLFETLKRELDKISDTERVQVATILKTLTSADKISTMYGKLSDEAKDYLVNEKGLTEEKMIEVAEVLNDELEDSGFIKQIITDKDADYSSVQSDLENLLKAVQDSLPDKSTDSINKYAASRDDKIKVLRGIIESILGTKIGKGVYSVSGSEWKSIDIELKDSHITSMNDAINEISPVEKNPLGDLHKNTLNSLANAALESLSATNFKHAGNILSKLELIEKEEVDKDTGGGDSGGSTGGGGSPVGGGGTPPAPKPTDPPKVEVPSEKDKPAKVVVGKDNVEIKEEAGKSKIKVKETETVKAIEELRKQAGKTKASEIEISLEDVKGLDFNVELSENLVKSLIKNNVSLKVKTANSEVEIPLAALKGIKVSNGSKLELKVEEKSKVEAAKVAPKDKSVKKVIDLNLVVTSGDKEEKVTEFKEAITVKVDVKDLGEADKLAVYYYNDKTDELEFVTGKIKEGMAILRLKHFSHYAVLESNITFEDIKTHWSKIYIESMAAKNIINGYEDGTFKPNNDITRSEFAKMMVLALELEVEEYNGSFSDVGEDAWYSDYVGTMVKNGLVKGYEDGTFKPNDKITRAEMTMIIANALETEVSSTEKATFLNKFNDKEDILAWVEGAVAKVVKENIIVGDERDNFNPNNTTTRAEAATAIYRLYNK